VDAELLVDLSKKELDVDGLEQLLLDSGKLIPLPLLHKFTPGLYIRELFMPTGAIVTSRIHNTEHPYAVLSGKAAVYAADDGLVTRSAGDSFITMPGTRRVLHIEEDCRWVTYHTLVDSEEEARAAGMDAEELADIIEERIFDRHELPGSDGMSVFEMYNEGLRFNEVVEAIIAVEEEDLCLGLQ
jgi:hypothetical protein